MSFDTQRSGEISVWMLSLGNVFRPEKSWAFGSPKAMKSSFCPVTAVPGSAALTFVISTGAQRSGEISVWMHSLGNAFSTERTRIFYFAPHGVPTFAALRK
jgi:hypothetical protein